MHIKKLEICGFKSFVDRTVIHFDHDVIGIVGPNGCGKSNIVDAIRWCMGEQSAKHLRGKAMEDVIFNGSESRGPHGFAEVTLTFDNTDAQYTATLPPEYAAYSEIAVTRRLFRDGTSEYLVNKTPVRLRDVTDLFLGTGVGTKAYSIVEQGRIGQIVSARPEDRRLFIDEAAGITKYKKRRQQAERKMDQTRQNLLRVSDILNEIERTRATLKRQAAKAERYIRYREELEELMLHQSAHSLLELIVVERVERETLGAAAAQAADARARLDNDEALLTAARNDAAAVEARSEEAAQEAFRADNLVSTLHADLARSRDQLSHLSERLRIRDKEKTDLGIRREQLVIEREDLDQRLRGLEEEAQARETDASNEEQSLTALRHEETQVLSQAGELREKLSGAVTESATIRTRLDALSQRVVEGHQRRDRMSGEREQLAGEALELEAQQAALQRSVAERMEGRRLSTAELEALEAELNALRPKALDVERMVDAAKNDLALKRNRLRVLEDLHRRLEGVGAGVRALLASPSPGVLGLVADRIEAPEEFTQALAGLLGNLLQCVVVSDPERGLELLEQLRVEGRGRATIAARQQPFVAGSTRRPVSGAGVIGPLAREVRYAPEDEALVRTLIGDAVVCETARDALDIVRTHPDVTAVSLDGTVAQQNGLIRGGSSDDVASAMLEQKREMRVLAEQVEQLEHKTHELTEEHRRIRMRMTEVGVSLDRARQGAHEHELAHVSAEKDLVRIVAEAERASARSRALQNEIQEIDEQVEAVLTEETQSRRQLDELERSVEQLQHSLAEANESVTAWKERVDAHAALVTERKVRLAQVREQIEAVRTARDRVNETVAEIEERTQRVIDDANDAASAFGETAAHMLLGRGKLVDAEEDARRARDVHEDVRTQLDAIRHDLGERETALKALRTELGLAEDTARHHELRLQKLELEREHLLRNVRERFRGLDLHRVVGKYHARPAPDDEHRRRIDELSTLIERMGPVNLDAHHEYEDAERRFDDLSKQKIDIEKALEDLERAIKHMNRESRRRFKETFESVNALFKKTFTELFRGGRAELVLTNPEDLLETGVDIVAQPPGKRLGNIELMSGGEKALTATSLIFAIFQHKPSPFCVLDEVDAPLDEANVHRYNDAIRNMTARSQFIVITHVKSTMQTVDVLYGVTMGEPGVSRIVSVKVNEQARSRSDRHTDAAPPQIPVHTQVA